MSYKVVLQQRVRREVGSWNLPDYMLVEVYLRLRERLGENPAASLVRITEPWDGMAYGFEMIDPQNRLRVFVFLFRVVYGQDEETLYIAHGRMFVSHG